MDNTYQASSAIDDGYKKKDGYVGRRRRVEGKFNNRSRHYLGRSVIVGWAEEKEQSSGGLNGIVNANPNSNNYFVGKLKCDKSSSALSHSLWLNGIIGEGWPGRLYRLNANKEIVKNCRNSFVSKFLCAFVVVDGNSSEC